MQCCNNIAEFLFPPSWPLAQPTTFWITESKLCKNTLKTFTNTLQHFIIWTRWEGWEKEPSKTWAKPDSMVQWIKCRSINQGLSFFILNKWVFCFVFRFWVSCLVEFLFLFLFYICLYFTQCFHMLKSWKYNSFLSLNINNIVNYSLCLSKKSTI